MTPLPGFSGWMARQGGAIGRENGREGVVRS